MRATTENDHRRAPEFADEQFSGVPGDTGTGKAGELA